MLGTTYKRLRRYLEGDPDVLCKSDGRSTSKHKSLLSPFEERINQLLSEGNNYKETYLKIQSEGYRGKYTILCTYCTSLVQYASPKAKKNQLTPKQYISRADIFKYLWSDKKEKVSDELFRTISKKYPFLIKIHECITEFREIYNEKNLTLLHDFISKYKKSKIKSISGFAGGLTKDKIAVENSVKSQYSNGFVEGNNNKLKLIKRQMYGRAKLPLLNAKIILRNDIFLPYVNH